MTTPREYSKVATADASIVEAVVVKANDGLLEESLVVSLVAPTDLPAHYDLDVMVQGRPTKVRVPEGGVLKGQVFDAIMVRQDPLQINDASTTPATGRWKDGSCDWFNLCLITTCCMICSLGQVMTRMDLNALAQPRRGRGMSACKAMFFIGCAYAALILAITIILPQSDSSRLVLHLCRIPLYLFFSFIVWQTRKLVRRKYSIREECCLGCEDCMCGFLCHWCAVAQMARHTGDFDRQQQILCSETGLMDRSMIV